MHSKQLPSELLLHGSDRDSDSDDELMEMIRIVGTAPFAISEHASRCEIDCQNVLNDFV